ncbi:unnamed protein product, partial [marine sediment metagenome]
TTAATPKKTVREQRTTATPGSRKSSRLSAASQKKAEASSAPSPHVETAEKALPEEADEQQPLSDATATSAEVNTPSGDDIETSDGTATTVNV